MPVLIGPSITSSRTVPQANWCSGFWKTYDILLASSVDFHFIGLLESKPSQRFSLATTSPSIDGINPAKVKDKVDFPAPFAPTKAVIWPELNSRLMFLAIGVSV
ncbi:Uncharacterised protein [Chlamydia trachomatis]|nr:Uncharacterised protein [Chlamydia trachomatis]